MGKTYLTSRKVKERYGVSDMTIWRWVKNGQLPAPILLGNRHYFAEDELDEADGRAAEAYKRAREAPRKAIPPPRTKK